jgi:hypothetical protein
MPYWAFRPAHTSLFRAQTLMLLSVSDSHLHLFSLKVCPRFFLFHVPPDSLQPVLLSRYIYTADRSLAPLFSRLLLKIGYVRARTNYTSSHPYWFSLDTLPGLCIFMNQVLQVRLALVCFTYSSALKMEATHSSKYWQTSIRLHIQEGRTIY